MKVIFLVLIFSLASGIAHARDHGNCDAAKVVVEQFIALELLGEGTHTSEQLDKLIDYQDRDIPGWDSFELTNESKIKSCKDFGDHVNIAVTHMVFGTISGSVSMEVIDQLSSRLPKEEVNMLRLIKTPIGWNLVPYFRNSLSLTIVCRYVRKSAPISGCLSPKATVASR